MLLFTTFFVGIIIGVFSKKVFLNWLKSNLIINRNRFKIRFHIYFLLHQSGKKLNEVIRTETVEVTIMAKDYEDAIGIVQEIINNEVRVEFESVEIDN
jgi:uncharacterized protein YneF (UPF0154 family)